MLSEEAIKMAEKVGLKYKVFGRDEALKLNMGGFCAVDSGSDQDGKFIVLEHLSSPNAPTIALVGKGVTFDTGGISIKPSPKMSDMKYDMGGSAVVVGLMRLLAQRKAGVNAVGVVGLVENMPSGSSYKPGDLLRTMSGQTIEVENTDAEGRIILADALTYAEKYRPRVVLDIATLTSAALAALSLGGCVEPDTDWIPASACPPCGHCHSGRGPCRVRCRHCHALATHSYPCHR